MKFELKNGKTAELIPASDKFTIDQLLEYINELIDEKAFILRTQKYEYKEEKEWYESMLKKIEQNNHLHYFLVCENKIIGAMNATRDSEKTRTHGNVLLGISLLEPARNQGIGTKLIEFLIKETKEKLNPKNIYLSVVSENKPAIALYKKVGFKEFAKFSEWIKSGNEYVDLIYLKL